MTAASPQPIGSRTDFQRLPGGGYAYVLVDDAVRIELRYLRRESRQLHAEVDVQCTWAGVQRHKSSLSCADLNLSSQSARRSLAKYCELRAKTTPESFDWPGVIDAACLECIQAERIGSDVIILDDAPTKADQEHNIFGLQVPADASSLLIAHGDGLKSLIVLLVLGTLATLGKRVLYLDYEWSAARHAERKRRLFGADRLEQLRYLRCRAPLTVEVESIRRYCELHAIDFIGVDSIGLAADGKLGDDDTAIRFHRALGTLPPSLCAAHVPKSSMGPDGKGDAIGPFGSVFFSNLCRKSWLVKKQPGASDDIVTVGLFVQKQNSGDRQRPVGLEFDFTQAAIAVKPVNLAGVDGLSSRLPLAARIAHLLQAKPLTYAEIAEQLDAKVNTISQAVLRSDAFVKVSDKPARIALVSQQHGEKSYG